ncbi:MAG: chemotaxis protein CheC [Bacillota bacterium]|nr:chemotaxis protein CheC [Bacillota bacterium]
MLTPMQKDVLVELFNIHVGASANLLSVMVNQKIILSIPEVELLSGSELNMFSFEQAGIFESGEAVMSNVKFGGEFKGSAYIMFPAAKAKALVSACLREDLSTEVSENGNLTFEELDVIKEICNVTLNSVIGEFGNLIDEKIEFTTPNVEFNLVSSMTPEIIKGKNKYILVLLTSFFIESISVKGVILISLDDSSVKIIINKINELLEEQNE